MTGDRPADVLSRQWDAAGAKAALLLVHGLGGHAGRWEPLAGYFCPRAVASYALCLRGFGDSPGVKGHIDSFRTYLSDIETLAGIISHERPHCPIFLLGESLGGLISYRMAARGGAAFSGLICLAPAFADTLEIGALARCAIFVSSLFRPQTQFTMPFSLSSCSRDEEMVKLFEADPREHRFATGRLLTETLYAQRAARRDAVRVRIPVLFCLSGRDAIVSTDASMRVFEALQTSDKALKVYPEMYHALSIDRGREEVFEDIHAWIRAHMDRGNGV